MTKSKSKSKGFIKKIIKIFKFWPTQGENVEDLEKIAAQEQKQFPFEILVAATKKFHHTQKLGEGGFGPVYKGKLDDGREIAVKKLSNSSGQGKKEFQNEAKLLARVQHRNVVNLLGYCVHGAEKLLVYEYVVNESIDKILFKSGKREVLDWKKRYDIMAGVAKGLLYLHEDAHCRIIHRDIKGSNILLDDKWVPKIADFGMARLYPENQTHVNTRVAGTKYVFLHFKFVCLVAPKLITISNCKLPNCLTIDSALIWEQWLYGTRVSYAWPSFCEGGCVQLWGRDFGANKWTEKFKI
ncbi:receptor kinase At4g00960 [Olea europaea subsp. europaea]|uniref:non-specific serine/threonine protein kinase n=1 Tax=Olea europaea subsp. europaea TaxID=158383 RepID=A0A8S0TZ01_OLEEU|nr:receptor kinase At4g00960 [Olea europaea subsp. europaea]